MLSNLSLLLHQHSTAATTKELKGVRSGSLLLAAEGVITHPRPGRSGHAMTVCRMVSKTLASGLSRAVSTRYGCPPHPRRPASHGSSRCSPLDRGPGASSCAGSPRAGEGARRRCSWPRPLLASTSARAKLVAWPPQPVKARSWPRTRHSLAWSAAARPHVAGAARIEPRRVSRMPIGLTQVAKACASAWA